jgi:cysteine/histidine-rich domain-containing protein
MEVSCYNRGCGKKFNPRDNPPDSTHCIHHPGAPFFHDAYKGWSCCNKKCTDFTEFLNTPGCTKGPHSNVKPEEPESITGKKDNRDLKGQLKDFAGNESKPNLPLAAKLARPCFDSTPLVRLKPTKVATLKAPNPVAEQNGNESKSDEIADGECCKNGGCKASFGSESANAPCIYHPGVPIFHEGMKFWSCCQRKTSDFQAFLDQAGCMEGQHKWIRDNEGSADVECRYDWHQTATHVVTAIYCKNYHPDTSFVEVSPIRLKVHVYFPEQGGSFNLDLELAGVISVDMTTSSFLGTKIEIKMKKAEPGSWAKLNFPRQVAKVEKKVEKVEETLDSAVDALELDDLEVMSPRLVLSNEASGGRTGQAII